MSYANLLNAIKNTAKGIPLTPDEEDTMILLNEQMTNFPLIKSQVGVVRNQILATATKQWVVVGQKSITGDNTYSGVNTFSGSLIATGTVQLANYKKTTVVSKTTSSSVSVSGTDAIYDFSVSSNTNFVLVLDTAVNTGESRSFDVIIPYDSSNHGYIQSLSVNDSSVTLYLDFEDSLEISSGFIKQHFKIWNNGSIVKAFSSVRHFGLSD